MKRAGLLIALVCACMPSEESGNDGASESSGGETTSTSSSSSTTTGESDGGSSTDGAGESSSGGDEVGGSESSGGEDPGEKDIWEPCNGGTVRCEADLACVKSYSNTTMLFYGYCAPPCQLDPDCPTPPGWPVACNYADGGYCMIPCDAMIADPQCPAGWYCHHSDGLTYDLCMPPEA